MLESENSRMKMMLEHSKELAESKVKQRSMSTGSAPDNNKYKKKCSYENTGTCRDKDRCLYFHPKKTCQHFSKMGSCLDEEVCQHRHPKRICSRLLNNGYCSYGDNCRDRHPLEFAVQIISQSRY